MSIFNILFLVFTALFIASAIVEITGYYKKISLMEYIANPCMYVFLLASWIMVLTPLLPDSLNIIICVSAAVLFGLTGACLQFLPKTKKNVAASALFFIASFLSFIILIRPSFRLFSLPRWASAAIFTAYLTLFVLYYIFSIGKRSLVKTAGITIFMIPLMVLHYGSILTLCGQPKLYSALLFAGSTIFIAAQALIVKGFFVKASPKDRLFRMILYIAGQFFVTAGFSLMVV